MKKILLLCAVLFSHNAIAGTYITGMVQTTSNYTGRHAGKATDRHEWLDRVYLDAVLGYDFQNGFRLEADVGFIGWDTAGNNFGDSFKIGAEVGMVRVLYDIHLTEKFEPYFGVGARNLIFDNNRRFGVAYLAGLSYLVANGYVIDLEFARIYTDYYTEKSSGATGQYSGWKNELRAGLRYYF